MIGSAPLASTAIGAPLSNPTASVVVADPPIVVDISASACAGLTTAGSIINRALLAIGQQGADAAWEADEYQDGIDALNDYMAALEAQGIHLNYRVVCNIADVVTVPAGAVRGLVANLAIELSPQYGATVSTALVRQAEEGMRAMERLGVHVPSAQLYPTLPMGSGNYRHSGFHENTFFGRSRRVVLSLANNQRETTIATPSQAKRAAAIWTIEEFAGFDADISGRITNTEDKVTRKYKGEFTVTGTVGSTVVLGVAKNGVMIDSAEQQLTSAPAELSITTDITLEPGEFIDVVVTDRYTASPVTLTNAIVRFE